MSFLSESPLRILVVEDDPGRAIIVHRSLVEMGFDAHRSDNDEEALASHRIEPYQIVIECGPASGELCRRFREVEGPRVYFLSCVARNDHAAGRRGQEAGVDDFLDAPLDLEELEMRLAVACRVLAAEGRVEGQRKEGERNARETAELNESLKLASRRFEDLFSGIPVACFTFDDSGCIHEWNRAAEEAFGVPAFDTIMRPVWEVLPTRDGVWSPGRCVGAISGAGHEEFEWSYEDGTDFREYACRIIALRGRCGAQGAVCVNVDVTAHKRAERLLTNEKSSLERANARLHDLASKDGLTGLWNRRAFLAELEGALAEFERIAKPFSLVLLDIDNFKAYNDSFGHPAGDETLRRFARVLRMTARSYEQPARYGGEEFVIVLHNTGADKAMAAAERFRRAVEEGDWVERGVTCSLGVATAGEGNPTAESIISAADAALYASKASGRNRCTHAIELLLLQAA